MPGHALLGNSLLGSLIHEIELKRFHDALPDNLNIVLHPDTARAMLEEATGEEIAPGDLNFLNGTIHGIRFRTSPHNMFPRVAAVFIGDEFAAEWQL